jgi:uncharacterized RDD family membrane protein YckC
MQQDSVSVETPEHISVEFELAGIGSRFLAALMDSLLQLLLLLALALGVGQVVALTSGDESQMPLIAGIVAVSSMLIIIVYYIAFEMTLGGQSPGKRLAKLVVVRDDGSPITFSESAIRNILRLVDILPIFYTVGMLSVFITGNCKRLGDIAAGTLVVKVRNLRQEDLGMAAPEAETVAEAGPVSLPADPLVQRAALHLSALTGQELDTLTRYMERRLELSPDSRVEVAERLAETLRPKFPAISAQDCPDAEAFLDVVAQARYQRQQDETAKRGG